MMSAFPDNGLDGLWEWVPENDALFVNARWTEIHGLAPEIGPCLSATRWMTLVHPSDRRALKRGLGDLLAGRSEMHEVDIRVSHDEAHWVWVLHRARLSLPATQGETPQRVHGTIQDISSRKRQEARLRESEDFLGRTGHIAGVGGWQADLLERRVTWSDETCRILGRPVGFRPSFDEWLACFDTALDPLIAEHVSRAIEQGRSFDIDVPIARADGKSGMVRFVGAVEFDDDKPVRLSGAVQDITVHALRRLGELGDSHRALERVNERLSLATDSGGIGIWDFDVEKRLFEWDERMFELYGLAPDVGSAMCGERWLELVHEDDRQRAIDAARGAITGVGPFELDFRIVTAAGEVRYLAGTARVIQGLDGRTTRIVGTNRDVSMERRMTRELARQHEVLTVTLRSIGDGVITTDTAGRVIWLNPVAEELIGWTADAARGRPIGEVFHIVDEDSGDLAPDPVRRCLDERRITAQAGDTVLVARSGERRWIEASAAPIRNDEGDVFGAVLVFHDVSEQRVAANEMTWRATHDELTGLLNRVEFEARLKCLLERTRTSDARHALLFLDLDRFKIVNDTCGHAAGDQLLRQVSRLLARTVRAGDVLVRLGGDEFAVILEHCAIADAREVAQEICDLMDEYRFVCKSQRFRIGASIGLVPLHSGSDDVEGIVRSADVACYAAKEAGRNRVHLWNESDTALHARHAQTRWATRLETALDEDGFELHAQRINALESSRSQTAQGERHAEILIRLRGSEADTLVLPGAFLPAAERYNLINRIDQWVLGRVIEWWTVHHEQTDVDTFWINLSGQSFGDHRFQEEALRRLHEAGDALCASLCFEITETAAVTNLEDAARFTNELRSLGVRVALDDFGAGASSFGYLKSLPVDFLKIDGQFVRDLTDDPLDAAAVRCFAEVAQIMNVKTVAEFVETPDVLMRLREFGVDYVQGWLLHKPVPLDCLLEVRDRSEHATLAS